MRKEEEKRLAGEAEYEGMRSVRQNSFADEVSEQEEVPT